MSTGFFEESEGVKSSTRLNSFILLWALIVINSGMLLYVKSPIDANFIMFNFIWLIGVFAPKYLHKLAERK